MENVKAALLRVVKAERELLKLDQAMGICEYQANPFNRIYNDIAMGIYEFIGEECQFEESITNLTLTAPFLTDERRVNMLMNEYRKHFKEVEKIQDAHWPIAPAESALRFDESLSTTGKDSFESVPSGDGSAHVACKE